MATKYRALLFKCNVLAHNNTTLESFVFDIELLDIENRKWEKLVTEIEAKKGVLSHEYEIPLRISKTDIITRIVRDCMSDGSLPMFRVVKSNCKESHILSEAPFVFFDEERLEINIDFQKLWLLEEPFFIKKDTSTIIASPFYLYEILQENNALASFASPQESSITIEELQAKNEKTEALLAHALEDKATEIDSLKTQLEATTKDDDSEKLNQLIKSLEERNNEIEKLLVTAANQDKQVALLQKQLELLKNNTSASNELNIRMEELENLIARYQQEIKDYQQLLEEKEQEITNINEELYVIENATSEAENFQISLLEKTTEIETLKAAQLLFEEDNKKTLSTVETAKNDLQTQQVAIDDLVEKVKIAQQIASEKDTEIALLSKNAQAKESEITKLQTKVAEVQSFVDAENPNKLDAKKVYSSIVNDIADADASMDTSRFKMANISLNLKATVEKGPEGTLFGLVDFESAKDINAAAISDISIDIVPNTTYVKTENTIPSILGLTETAARKILTNYGLKLDVIYQPTENPKFIAGQAIKQIPQAGETLVQGQEVIVIFAKPLKK